MSLTRKPAVTSSMPAASTASKRTSSKSTSPSKHPQQLLPTSPPLQAALSPSLISSPSFVPKKQQQQQAPDGKPFQHIPQHHIQQNYFIGKTSPICYLRVRPLFLHEGLFNKTHTIEVLDKESLIFTCGSPNDTSTQQESSTTPITQSTANNHNNINNTKLQHQQQTKAQQQPMKLKDDLINLTSDRLFRCHRTILPDQQNITLQTFEFPSIIEELLHGKSHAFLAIGGENSGKTHSIFGTLSDPGLIMLFVESLFNRTNPHNTEPASQSRTQITASFMKYKDDFYDLLCPTTKDPLPFKLSKTTACMPTLTQVTITSLVEFFVYLRLALRSLPSRDFNREIMYNGAPERCHAIISFKIVHREMVKIEEDQILGDKMEEHIAESEMVFIDCDHIEPNERIENKPLEASLIALENIMQYVYEINEGLRPLTSTHIPYDSSKFTTYYKHYLFGRNQLILLGTLSPYMDHYEDSSKTARLVQWTYKSKNHVEPMLFKGTLNYEKVPIKEVGFIRKIHHQTNVLGDDLRMYAKITSIKTEEKLKYTNAIKQILQDQYQLFLRNLKLIHACIQVRATLFETRQKYLNIYYVNTRDCVKRTELRELYLIRFPYQPSFELEKQLLALELEAQKLTQRISILSTRFNDLALKFKTVIDMQAQTYRSILKSSHFDCVNELSNACYDFLRWTQASTIRAFSELNSSRIDSQVYETSTKILSLIEYFNRRIAISATTATTKQATVKPQSNNTQSLTSNPFESLLKRKQTSTFRRIPSEMALRSLQSISTPEFKLIDAHDLAIQQQENSSDSLDEINLHSIPNQNNPNQNFQQQQQQSSFQFLRDSAAHFSQKQQQQQHPILASFSTSHTLSNRGKAQQSSVMAAFQSLLKLSENQATSSTQSLETNPSNPRITRIASFTAKPFPQQISNSAVATGGNSLQKSILTNSTKEIRSQALPTPTQLHPSKSVFFIPSNQLTKKGTIDELNSVALTKQSPRQTSFDNLDRANSTRNHKNHVNMNAALPSSESNTDSNKKILTEESDRVSLQLIANNSTQFPKKYSLGDLIRIETDLQATKQRMREDKAAAAAINEKLLLQQQQQQQYNFATRSRNSSEILSKLSPNQSAPLGQSQGNPMRLLPRQSLSELNAISSKSLNAFARMAFQSKDSKTLNHSLMQVDSNDPSIIAQAHQNESKFFFLPPLQATDQNGQQKHNNNKSHTNGINLNNSSANISVASIDDNSLNFKKGNKSNKLKPSPIYNNTFKFSVSTRKSSLASINSKHLQVQQQHHTRSITNVNNNMSQEIKMNLSQFDSIDSYNFLPIYYPSLLPSPRNNNNNHHNNNNPDIHNRSMESPEMSLIMPNKSNQQEVLPANSSKYQIDIALLSLKE